MYPLDLHMHTVASPPASSTLRDSVLQAQTCGATLLALTDHRPDMAGAPPHRPLVHS